MGRKSNLSPAQWTEIGKRLFNGERGTALAREFGVSESTIRGHFERAERNAIGAAKNKRPHFETELVVNEVLLPEPPPCVIDEISGNLRAIALTYTRVANISINTAMRCATLANTELTKVDDADPSSSEKHLKMALLLQRMTTDALDPARSLIMASANKELLQRALDDTAKSAEDEVLTPERIAEAARRIAFVLARAGAMEN